MTVKMLLLTRAFSYSRKAYSEAVSHQSAKSIIGCLENAFQHFGAPQPLARTGPIGRDAIGVSVDLGLGIDHRCGVASELRSVDLPVIGRYTGLNEFLHVAERSTIETLTVGLA